MAAYRKALTDEKVGGSWRCTSRYELTAVPAPCGCYSRSGYADGGVYRYASGGGAC